MNTPFILKERAYSKLTQEDSTQKVFLENEYVMFQKMDDFYVFTFEGILVFSPALISLSYQPENPKKWRNVIKVTEEELITILNLNYRILNRHLNRTVQTLEGTEPATAADAMGTLALLTIEGIKATREDPGNSPPLIYDYSLIIPHMAMGAMESSSRRLEIIRKGYSAEDGVFLKDFPDEWFEEL